MNPTEPRVAPPNPSAVPLSPSPMAPEAGAEIEAPLGRFGPGAKNLRATTARGTIINAAFLVGFDTLGVLKGFIVAAFLTTAEFGIWGILVVALGTLGWLKQVGIGDKYIQQDESDQELAFQKAFTLELLFNAVILAVLLAALPLFAAIYGRWEIVLPGLAAATVLPALALQTPIWVFYRRMRFVRQRSLQAVDPIVAFLVTVTLAFTGFGYWSLVLGVVAGSWASALVAVAVSPYRLAFRYERGTMRQYASFSWPLFVASASGLLLAQISIFVGQAKLGLAGVGVIALASSISVYTDKVDAIITQTLYPAICAVRDRTDLLFESFTKSNRLALMWGVPFGVGLALFAPDLVRFGLGARWEPAVGLLQAFGLIAAINHIGFNWSAFYRAHGDTRPLAIVNGITLVAFLATGVPLLLSYGLDGFAVGMGIATAVNLAGRAYFLKRLFPGLRMSTHLMRAMAPTIPAALCVLAAQTLIAGDHGLGVALGELLLYAAVTAAATLLFERALLREVIGYLQGGGRANPAPAA